MIIYDVNDIPKLLLPTMESQEIDDIGTSEIVRIPSVAKAARADRLTKLIQDAHILEGRKKAEVSPIDPDSISESEVIFRVMIWDHIPIAPPKVPKVVKGKKGKEIVIEDDSELLLTEYDEDVPEIKPPSSKINYVKVNFPPFEHWKVTADNTLELIGKSHWKGDIITGEFNKDHGKITNKLALMYMKLCERYATRSNWRGYTYNDEMRSQALLQLSQIGLQFDEAKSANPFAYYTAAITNSFTRVLNIEKRNQNIRDDILEMNNLSPSYSRQSSWGDGGHGADE